MMGTPPSSVNKLLNIQIMIIAAGGVVAIILSDIVLATVMLTAAIVWLGFFLVANAYLIVDAVMSDMGWKK